MRAEDLHTQGGRVRFVDIKPPNLSSETPTHVVSSGWGGSILPMAEEFEEIAHETKSHFILNDVHLDGRNPNDGPSYARELSKGAVSLNCLIEAKRIKKPVLVGYSKAGPVSTIAGLLRREAISGLVLVNPASLIGRDSAAELVSRYALGAAKNTVSPRPDERIPMREAVQNVLRYIQSNGIHSLREIQELSVVPLHELIPHLRSRGIPIAVLASRGDMVFPISRMRQMIFSNGRSIVDAYEEMDGDHGVLVSKPKQVLHKIISTSKRIVH
jgi:pimeloyl-ACP methyl ester carboxylesterase